jgi:prepilin signal peptidase PulO-like enzyme (type II secretory pathway)
MQRIGELFAPKRAIVSATKARGFTEEELEELRKLAKKGLIGKRISVKESMPFVPTMLLGYGFCLLLGDAFWMIMLWGLL